MVEHVLPKHRAGVRFSHPAHTKTKPAFSLGFVLNVARIRANCFALWENRSPIEYSLGESNRGTDSVRVDSRISHKAPLYR